VDEFVNKLAHSFTEKVGAELEGANDGLAVGAGVGRVVGEAEGFLDGAGVGEAEGLAVVGLAVGTAVVGLGVGREGA
jgi:hypothetical protein